ncbi:5-formyltetrahydrofolate cyclo-ligase [Leucobacter triazinivorans]|uniref:5-formyltetrahydrofolate cyclo-ligase n=1 Tax=Leucobacter triazinivorans TaxID=1784719 RepID=A0A4P6KGG9_9MICO|nr:5-formyltetrahydrofolate cyclo-ligase [Leucobacter triazinivorans]QBE49516.1 5-formyltetrahydrofolate cyclo-ligase [Leucobacter triazinivorans]
MGEQPNADEATKREVRAAVRTRRRRMSDGDRAAAAAALTTRLVDLVERSGARTVTGFASLPDEPDTGGFLAWAATHDVAVLLPVVRPSGQLDWVPSTGRLAPGPLGIPEPLGDPVDADALARVDLMLIPACAVDRRGVRLGWGGGYFDRLLGGLAPRPPVYAVVFDEDLLPRLPREAHDVPVDGVVTPSGVRRLGAFGGPGPAPDPGNTG